MKAKTSHTITLAGAAAQELNILLFTFPVSITPEEYISSLIHEQWQHLDAEIQQAAEHFEEYT